MPRETDPGDLVDRLGRDATARGVLAEQFGTWWQGHDDRAAELLDFVARAAGTAAGASANEALDVLLDLVLRHRLARPAIRRYLIDEHDVADAEQATLAVVGLRVDTWDQRARFTTWLHRVAENEAKMLIRARTRRPSIPVAEPELAAFVARLSTVVADREVVDRAIAALPDELRRPLVLREIDQLEYAEIADTLGLEIGTVRSRLHRARSLLVTELRARLV